MKIKKLAAAALAALLGASLLAGCGAAGSKKEYRILDETLKDEHYVIGFKKGNETLRDEVQRILVELQKDGTLSAISKEWFGEDKSIVPTTFTPSGATDDSLQKVKDKGVFTLGLDDSFPPMGFRSENGMDVVGFDIDVAKKVCEKMGVTLVTQPISWDAKDSELSSGKIDCIWNGFTSLPEREEAMTLSFPYMVNKQVVVVLKDSPIKTLADLKDKTVVLQKGSSALDALEAKRGQAFSQQEYDALISFTYNLGSRWMNVLALNDLGKGANGGDAVIMDEVVAKYYTSHRDQLVKDTASKAE